MTLKWSPLAHTVAGRALVAVGLVLDRTAAPATMSRNTDKLSALKGGGDPFNDQAHRKSLSHIAAISILAALLSSPSSAQTADERLQKARDEVNLAQNLAEQVAYACARQQYVICAEKARLAANAAGRALYAVDKAIIAIKPPVVPPIITYPTLADLKPIASTLNVPSLLSLKSIPPSAAPDVVGAFRFLCAPGQISYDDPIVYPGKPKAAHLHQFFGNLAADAFSTYESLRKSGDSTCQNDLNRSAYWMPAMLDGKGSVVRPDFVSIYYKRRPVSDPVCMTAGTGCLGTPAGIRFVFGWDQTRPNEPQPENAARFNFKCVQGWSPTGPATPGMVETMKVCKPGQWLSATINSPDCWNGKDLDSANHRSHLAYMIRDRNSGKLACPATHPKIIPTFTMNVGYSIEAGDDPTLWTLSSDHMLPPHLRRAGSTFHSDYFEGWEPDIRFRWEGGCLNKMLNCSDGDLGDGRIMTRGKYYPPAKASPRLVPVPPQVAMEH